MIFALGLALAALPAGARAQCPRQPHAVAIDIEVPTPRIVYHHDVDLFGLPKLEHHSERPPKGWTILGLTKISDQIHYRLQWGMLPLADGRVCVYLQHLNVLLGDAEMHVYVAAEYPEDSCEYKVILAHENTHVRFNLETLRDWMPSVRASLSESALRKFPVIYPAPPKAEDLVAYLSENMHLVAERMDEDMAQRNATIDTPEAYHKTSLLCTNWHRPGMKIPE